MSSMDAELRKVAIALFRLVDECKDDVLKVDELFPLVDYFAGHYWSNLSEFGAIRQWVSLLLKDDPRNEDFIRMHLERMEKEFPHLFR